MRSQRRQVLLLFLALGGVVGGPGPASTEPEAGVERELATTLRSALDALQRLGASQQDLEDRRRAVDAVVAALGQVTDRAKELHGLSPDGPEAAEVGKLVARACALEVPAVFPAAWRAAAWFGHPASIAAFQTAGERMLLHGREALRTYLAIARDVPSLDARRAFLVACTKVWIAGPGSDDVLRTDLRVALDACAAAACTPPEGAPPAAPSALLAAFEAAMKTNDEELFADLALALASAPCEGPRGALRRAIKSRKATREETVTAVLRTLGERGDAAAVALLLAYLRGTSGPVFGAAYFGLWQARPEGLRPHAKDALATLIPLLHEEGYAANAMSGASTPKAIRVKERMNVVTRLAAQMVPESKEGSGWHALLWKIVDAAGGSLRTASPPPERKGWVHVNGRVSPLGTGAWVEWWKTVR